MMETSQCVEGCSLYKQDTDGGVGGGGGGREPQEIASVLTCRRAGLHEAFPGPLGRAQALAVGMIEQALP